MESLTELYSWLSCELLAEHWANMLKAVMICGGGGGGGGRVPLLFLFRKHNSLWENPRMEERRSPWVKQEWGNAVPCQNKQSSRPLFPLTTTICNRGFLPINTWLGTICSEIVDQRFDMALYIFTIQQFASNQRAVWQLLSVDYLTKRMLSLSTLLQ